MTKVKNKRNIILHHFDSKDDAISGIDEIPVWFRSYDTISAGDQTILDIALNMDSFIIIDEFTSKLDGLSVRSLKIC